MLIDTARCGLPADFQAARRAVADAQGGDYLDSAQVGIVGQGVQVRREPLQVGEFHTCAAVENIPHPDFVQVMETVAIVEVEATPGGTVLGAVSVCQVLAPIAFVGGDQIGDTVEFITVDSVGHVSAQQRPLANIDAVVAVAGIQFVADQAVVLESEAENGADLSGVHINHGDGVVFLQRNPGSTAVRRDGNVLGLEVLGHAGALG